MNKLLQRQVYKYLGCENELPENITRLLAVISDSYDHFEKDRRLMERSIEISSKEMVELNTELNKEKDELKKTNKELSSLFENINEVFYSMDMVTNRLRNISAACEKVYGYTADELMETPYLWQNIVHPDDHLITYNQAQYLLQGNNLVNQYRIIHKNGSVRWIENKIIPTINPLGLLVQIDGVFSDISERKQAELNLEKSFSILEATLEASADGILVLDLNLNIIQFNNKVSELWKIPIDVLNENKKEQAISVVVEQIENLDDFFDLTKDLHFNKEKISQDILKIKDSRLIECYSHPHLINGNIVGRVWSFRDITTQKISEENLALKNKQLEQKNKELEQFAYVASHDLQEPLRTISSFVELFVKEYSEKLSADANKYLSYIIKASDRLRVLISDLLDFSIIGNNKTIEEVDCNAILKSVLEDIDTAIAEANAIIITKKLPVVFGFATEIKQLFQNLVVNAIKFRKPGLPPYINISAIKEDSHWHFTITDNGIGIEKTHFERIFVIFQRLHTRIEYSGSGIGLSHCKKIVELHKGKIWVESFPGMGSTFHFTINHNNN